MARIRWRRGERLQPLAAKVPEITVMFWVLKVLTTGMGEAMSDFLGSVNVPLAGVVGIGGLWLALRLQLRTREYRAPTYWFAVMMVAVFGTMAADGLHDGTSLPYPVTTIIYGSITALVFLFWYRSEGTLSIHTITTRRRENYYWTAVFATFALGTALGDMTATSLNMGYLQSAVLFAAIISIPAVLWWRSMINPIAAFWFAYIVTRPLGASFADWFSKPPSISGLGLGDGTVSAIALGVFVILVGYVTVTQRDIQPAPISHQDSANPLSHGTHAPAGSVIEVSGAEG
jgi:uncharacterized membrane-anchored protein